MANISQIRLLDNTTYNIKDANVPHTSESAASGGTTLSLVTTGEKATWNAKSDTDNKVTQTATTTNANYEVLFSGTADNTTRTEGARKNSNLCFNPSTGRLDATTVAVSDVKATDVNTTNINGVTVGSSPKFTDNNTTYTFANGTNGFTVTPSGGSAQTVTVTPSITNNVTGTGTSGYIAKFNGAHTVTNGPAFGSSTTTYLRNDGSWTTPSNTTYTLGTSSNNVTLTPSSGSVQSITVPYATKAGSSNSAGTAETWATARNLTIGNTAKSVNGSANVAFPNPLKIGFCGSDSANTAGWYRIMTVSQSGYSDTNLNLLLTSGYSKNASGILHVHVRCNNSTANSLQSLCWLSRYGWSIGDVYYKDHGNNTWSLYVYQANTQYGRVQVQILTETNTAGGQLNITLLTNGTRESSLSGGTASWEGAIDLSSSLSVSGNLQSVTKKFFDHSGVVELFMTGSVKTAIADNGVFLTVPSGYNPKVNDVGFTFFTGSDQYIPTGMRFGYFTWGGRDFHTLGALGVGTQVTVHITYLI